MRLFFIISLLICEVFAQNLNNFPLWGSSWIVAQGNNKKIFTSVLPVRPDKLALIEFNSDKSIFLHYANLDHRFYRCTSELLSDIKTQFETYAVTIPFDSIVAGAKIHISYQPFNDTVWTGDPDITNYFKNYQQIGRIIETTDSIFGPANLNKLRNTPTFFREKPVYYGIRWSNTDDEFRYTIQSYNDDGTPIRLENKNYLSKPVKSEASGIQDFAKTDFQLFSEPVPFVNYRSGNKVYEYIPVNYEFRTANIGFWQIHLHPEVWYYPRDPFDGTPYLYDSLKLTEKEASSKKKASINNPNDLNLKYYRNPYLSDSASFILSFAFANMPGTDMTTLKSISLTDSTVDITHYPDKMYRISSQQTAFFWNSCKNALYQLYSKDETDEQKNSSIDNRCPLWEIIDKQNAEIVFPSKIQLPGKLVRDKNIDDGIFMYNDCPCSRISSLNNLTPLQLQRLAFLSPPLCDRGDMIKAINIYNRIIQYLKKPSDQEMLRKKINTVNKIVEEGDRRAAAAGIDWSKPNKDCPDTWIKEF